MTIWADLLEQEGGYVFGAPNGPTYQTAPFDYAYTKPPSACGQSGRGSGRACPDDENVTFNGVHGPSFSKTPSAVVQNIPQACHIERFR
jgi:hypothetical protein